MATYPPNQTTPGKGSGNYLWNWLGSSLKKFGAAISPYITGGGGGGTPGGPTNSVQYNNNGALAGSPDFTYEVVPPQLAGLTSVGNVNAYGIDGAASIWEQGGYLFVLNADMHLDVIEASTLSVVVSAYDLYADAPSGGGNAWQVYGDGTYIYIGVYGYPGSAIMVYQFDSGTNTLNLIAYNNDYFFNQYSQMWGDGTYIYATTSLSSGSNDAALTAYQVQAGALVTVARYTGPDLLHYYSAVFFQNGYVYVTSTGWNGTLDPSVIQAYTFNGTTFTKVHQQTIVDPPGANVDPIGLTGDGTYLFVISYYPDQVALVAFSHTNTGFTQLAYTAAPEQGDLINFGYYADGLVYLGINYDGTDPTVGPPPRIGAYYAYKFDGISWSQAFQVPLIQGPGQCFVASLVADANNYYLFWRDGVNVTNVVYKYAKNISPSVPTPTLKLDGDIEITGNIQTNTINGVKKYVALLTQTGIDPPVATVLENTLGANITFSRINFGEYRIITDSIFPDGKIWATADLPNYNGNQCILAIGRISDTECNIYSYAIGGAPQDLHTNGDYVSIEIRIYP